MAQKRGPGTVDIDATTATAAAESHRRHDSHRREAHQEAHQHDQHEGRTNGREREDSAPRPAEAPAAQSPAEERIAELEAALEAAKAEAAEHWDKYLRERAEMENYKRRLERNQADQIKRVRKDLLLKTLSVLDNLERALAYQADGANVDAKSVLTGLQLTYAQFKDLLSSEGLKEVSAVGEQFDPAQHEAVTTEVAPDKPEGKILAELQKGYMLGDELLRPARVKVATRQ